MHVHVCVGEVLKILREASVRFFEILVCMITSEQCCSIENLILLSLATSENSVTNYLRLV